MLFGRLNRAYDEHRAARDRLTVLVSAKGAGPGRAEGRLRRPRPTSTPAQIEAVARTIERRMTQTYGELVANTSGTDRRWAIAALDASALRELTFGAAPSTFPGDWAGGEAAHPRVEAHE